MGESPYRAFGASVNYQLYEMTGHSAPVTCLALHPYGDLILSCAYDNTVRLWPVVEPGARPTEAAKVFTLTAAPGAPEGRCPRPTSAIFLHVEPQQCLISYSNHELALVDTTTMQLMQRWNCCTVGIPTQVEEASHEEAHMHVVSHPMLPIAIVGLSDGRLLCVDTGSGTIIREIQTHQGALAQVAIDGAGQTILSIGADTTVRYWDMTTWECRQQLEGHLSKGDEGAHCVGFHMVKQLAASGGADAVVRVWGAT